MNASSDNPIHEGVEALRHALTGPRGTHLAAVQALREALPALDAEAWNTTFDTASLYDAWSQAPVMRGLYAANAATLRTHILHRHDWTIVEIGGGDGRLWQTALTEADRGTLVVVDPADEPHVRLMGQLPAGVRLDSRREAAPCPLPAADVVVCSLTLHHVAGADADERARHGLSGPGKLEALRHMVDALGPSGLLVLNEADVHCDLGAPSGNPILADRLLDSYVRRCAMALCDALDAEGHPEHLRHRWWAIIRRWCLNQLDHATLPVAERDVYELDVERWLALLDRAGFEVVEHRFTDPWNLFHRYVCRSKG